MVITDQKAEIKNQKPGIGRGHIADGRPGRSFTCRVLSNVCLLLASCFLFRALAFAQQPQAQSGQPLYPVNSKYVNGVAPGYWPTAGAGLMLNLSAGTSSCGVPPVPTHYAGGTLTLAPSATNYVYLDPAENCSPASNSTGFSGGLIPIAKVTTNSTTITGVNDVRSWFTPQPFSTLGVDGWGISVANAVLKGPGPWADVMAYGAKGDGATDDGPAFHAAVEAAHAANTMVYVPEGQFVLNENPFAGLTAQVSLVLSSGTILMPSVPIAMGGFGQAVVGLVQGNGFTATSPTGAVIQPTAGFSGTAVIKIDPAVVGPGNVVSGDYVANLIFDMTNKPAQQVLEIRSLSNTSGFDNLVFTESSGTRIFIGQSANAGAQVSEGLNFSGVQSYGPAVLGSCAGHGPGVIIQDAGQIHFHDVAVRDYATDTDTCGDIGVLIQGNIVDVDMDDVYVGGYSTAFKVQNLPGDAYPSNPTPIFVQFLGDQIEGYMTCFDLSGTAAYPTKYNWIENARATSQIGTNQVGVKLGDYAQHTTVIAPQAIYPPSTKQVLLTANASNNTVFVDSPDTNVTDNSGGNNLIFGRAGLKTFRTNGGFASGVNSLAFSATPTFDAELGNTQKITLTGNVTSSSLSNATAGEKLDFEICQDGAGSHTFVWPTNVKGGMTIGSTASKCSAQSFIFDGTNAYALGPGSSNM